MKWIWMEIFPRDSEWEEGGRKEMKLNASTFTVLKIQCKSKGQRRARAPLKKSKMAELLDHISRLITVLWTQDLRCWCRDKQLDNGTKWKTQTQIHT